MSDEFSRNVVALADRLTLEKALEARTIEAESLRTMLEERDATCKAQRLALEEADFKWLEQKNEYENKLAERDKKITRYEFQIGSFLNILGAVKNEWAFFLLHHRLRKRVRCAL